MPIIIPRGLLKGDRIGKLSDEARFHWPFIYAGSNGFGRIELNYHSIINRCFRQFDTKPTRQLIVKILREYKERRLLFLYTGQDGKKWGAWDSVAKQNWYSKEDEASPAPPEPAFSEWKQEYQISKTSTDGGELDEELFDGSEVESHSGKTEKPCGNGKNSESPQSKPGKVLSAPLTSTSTSSSKTLRNEEQSNIHPFPVSQSTRALAELNDWSKPDIQELAKSLAIELQPNHPKFADRTRAEISIRTCLLNCLDPAAECAEIRARHSDLVEEFEAELRMNPKAWLPRLEDWISGLGYKQKIRKRTRGALALNHDPYEELK